MTSLIHAQQIINLNSQDSRFLTDVIMTEADRKHKTNKQLQKLKNNKNQCLNYEKINHFKFNY